MASAKDLGPHLVVAGHKQPGGGHDPANIDESIGYLADFNEAEAQTRTATELYERVLGEHPRRANPDRTRPELLRAFAASVNGEQA